MPKLLEQKELIQYLFDQNLVQREVRKYFDVADMTFRKFCRTYNIGIRTKKEVRKILEQRREENRVFPISDIVQSYHAGESLGNLAKYYHTSEIRIRAMLCEQNVKIRCDHVTFDIEQIMKMYYEDGKPFNKLQENVVLVPEHCGEFLEDIV